MRCARYRGARYDGAIRARKRAVLASAGQQRRLEARLERRADLAQAAANACYLADQLGQAYGAFVGGRAVLHEVTEQVDEVVQLAQLQAHAEVRAIAGRGDGRGVVFTAQRNGDGLRLLFALGAAFGEVAQIGGRAGDSGVARDQRLRQPLLIACVGNAARDHLIERFGGIQREADHRRGEGERAVHQAI